MASQKSVRVFSVLIISQFCGTSLWFAGNAILPQLQATYGWASNTVGHLTSAVQLGFIAGTLIIAVTGITDRYSPSRIFFISSLIGGLCNALCLLDLGSLPLVLTSRVATGISLAGIYPVGMKIAADWREQGLGNWLGALVGALVLGTSFPHALKLFPDFVEPRVLIMSVSILAFTGGGMVLLLIPNGPFRLVASKFSFSSLREVFRDKNFSSAAYGYFGHMWELYAFWAFVPWLLSTYSEISGTPLSIPLWSFIVIGVGGLGCALGGLMSRNVGSEKIALTALLSSGLCCLTSIFAFQFNAVIFLGFVIFWGFMVVADSPQFSALTAKHTRQSLRGSAMTLIICIGFAITIFSIQLLNFLLANIAHQYLLVFLSIGPLLGVGALLRKKD